MNQVLDGFSRAREVDFVRFTRSRFPRKQRLDGLPGRSGAVADALSQNMRCRRRGAVVFRTDFFSKGGKK